VKLPVPSFAAPTTVGPTNPPRLPIELISASPAAAPVPDRIAVGKDQKLAIAAKIPAVATESTSIAVSKSDA